MHDGGDTLVCNRDRQGILPGPRAPDFCNHKTLRLHKAF